MNTKLSIIIVSWNVKARLRDCLLSLQKYLPQEQVDIWVVDNASEDGSADMVETEFPDVNLIRNNTNRGFGAANNQALEYATGEYVLFLNDDTYIDANLLPMLDVFESSFASKLIGMIGGAIHNPDGTTQPSVRRFPTLLDQIVIACKLHKIFPGIINHYIAKDFDYTKKQLVDQVMGAFMFMPRSIINELGAFDEDFFTWFEEVDLQKRIHNAGYGVLYDPSVSCVHIGGVSFAQLRRVKAQWIFMNSMGTYFRKHSGLLAYGLIRFIQPFSVLLAYVYQTLLVLAQRNRK